MVWMKLWAAKAWWLFYDIYGPLLPPSLQKNPTSSERATRFSSAAVFPQKEHSNVRVGGNGKTLQTEFRNEETRSQYG